MQTQATKPRTDVERLSDALYETVIICTKRLLAEYRQRGNAPQIGIITVELDRMETGEGVYREAADKTARDLLQVAPLHGIKISFGE